jgi:hypothetical protein
MKAEKVRRKMKVKKEGERRRKMKAEKDVEKNGIRQQQKPTKYGDEKH